MVSATSLGAFPLTTVSCRKEICSPIFSWISFVQRLNPAALVMYDPPGHVEDPGVLFGRQGLTEGNQILWPLLRIKHLIWLLNLTTQKYSFQVGVKCLAGFLTDSTTLLDF